MIQIENSDLKDLDIIFEFYKIATEYMKSKKQIAWPKFSKELVEAEIQENRQWKLLIDGELACIWAIAFDDMLIWGDKNSEPSVYLHRIATNPNFRGQKQVIEVVKWIQLVLKRID